MQPDYGFTKVENADEIIQEQIIMPSTIETIDTAFYNYINEKVSLISDTNEGIKKVNIVWSGAERTFQIKKDPNLRDGDGFLNLPLVAIERKSMEKDPNFKGAFQAHFPDGVGPKRTAVPVARRIVQGKTNNFATADSKRKSNTPYTINYNIDPNRKRDNKKVVYETLYSPIPVYVKVMYSLSIRTNYQMQMNDLVTPFITGTGQINSFSITHDKHRYEVFIESDFSYDNTINSENEERVFQTTISFRVLGYLIGEGINSDKQVFSKYENFVEVKIPRERVITNTENTTTEQSFYKP